MDEQTRQALGEINRRFYRRQAEGFSNTRSAPWGGWSRVLEALEGPFRTGARSEPPGDPASPPDRPPARGRSCASDRLGVLDVGCGNGRFGTLLEERWRAPFFYWGVDASEELLATAADRLDGLQDLRLSPWNLLEEDGDPLWSSERFSLVVVFGLMHHVPGADLRLRLLRSLSRCLEPGGLLAVSVWRFGLDERFQRRILPWEEFNRDAERPIPLESLEEGDVLLRWGNEPGVFRYCHAVSEAEQEAWEGHLGLRSKDRFLADGRSEQLNRYHLFQAPPAEV
ncbi:MAG: methyltransferase domain-containing protein [Deltaproteobacteria bacterium]|nr:methyltransferase domain-containing protein [Deltaproteobacteria bacterium]